MKTVHGIQIDELNGKQRGQLLSLCEEFQPHGNFEDVVFLKVIFAARMFCDGSFYPFRGNGNKKDRFDKFIADELMAKIKSKYYFNGLKYANLSLKGKQYSIILNVGNAPKIRLPDFGMYLKHNPVEKELFMKVVRACRDYMREKMSKQAQEELFERLCVVYDAIG